MKKVLISLFDYTGNASRPYRENGWKVYQVDQKLGQDIMTWDYIKVLQENIDHSTTPEFGIIAMIPCTCYALCGNRHKAARLANGEFDQAQQIVQRTKEIIDFFDNERLLRFWQVENPRTDLHKKNPWLGKITQRFNPCDYAGYDPIPDNSRYNKDTWLFGRFNKMTPKPMTPIYKENPGWKNLGGKSERTKELRSISPLGYCYAFYDANH